MDLVQRVQGILLKPKEEWVKIKAEPTTVFELYTSYVMILAAIPAIAQLIGRLVFRVRVPFKDVPVWSTGRALSTAVLSYVIWLATVYIIALIIDALAPSFSSVRSLPNALKLGVYSMTPYWVASVLYFIPGLSILVLLAGLYGLYLLYLGFETPMMETPRDKVLGYLVVCFVAVLVVFLVFGLILRGIAAFWLA
jgi:hypothetical protein